MESWLSGCGRKMMCQGLHSSRPRGINQRSGNLATGPTASRSRVTPPIRPGCLVLIPNHRETTLLRPKLKDYPAATSAPTLRPAELSKAQCSCIRPVPL